MYIMIPATAAITRGKRIPPSVISIPKMLVMARQIKAPITSLQPDSVA